jgi:hypothetical protein
MKSINKMAVGALLALSSAGLASAQTYHVTGSTAYRVADVTAEVLVCGGASAKATFYGSAGATSAPSLTGASYSVITNSSGSLKFENYFNGSIAGDEALVDGVTTLPFPNATDSGDAPTTVTTAGSSSAASTGGTYAGVVTSNSTLAPFNVDQVSPDIAFSDVSFDTADQIILNSTDKTSAQPAGTALVGIVPFVFVANASTDVTDLAGLSMDPQKFTYTWNSGASATLSFYTGVHADEAPTVYPMGRDVDSGTRGTALAETGYGLAGSGIITTAVAQFYPYNSVNNANNDTLTGVIGVDSTLTSPTIAAMGPVPAESIDGYSMPLGDGGYYSGGNLATGISTAFASGVTDTVLMTYLGVSDAKSALTATGTNRQAATLMAYNGVTFNPYVSSAANSSLIYEGKYTFWGYEHLNYKSGAAAIAATGTGNTLKSELNAGIDQLSSNNVTISGMTVSRSDDGSLVQ